jgi:hypothetical protein
MEVFFLFCFVLFLFCFVFFLFFLFLCAQSELRRFGLAGNKLEKCPQGLINLARALGRPGAVCPGCGNGKLADKDRAVLGTPEWADYANVSEGADYVDVPHFPLRCTACSEDYESSLTRRFTLSSKSIEYF